MQVRAKGLTYAVGGVIASTFALDKITNGQVQRAGRLAAEGGAIVLDFKYHLNSKGKEDPEYTVMMKELHLRTAKRLLGVCLANKGIFTKFGQHLASLNHVLPPEYTQTLSPLQDQATSIEFSTIKETIESELGRPVDELFQHISPTPLAAASLAQVHYGKTIDGEEVAIKVQYPFIQDQFRTDVWFMKVAFQLTEKFFPGFQFQWILPEFREAMQNELDFIQEKENGRRISRSFAQNSQIHVPHVYDNLSTSKVMTMEYVRGVKVTDVGALKKLEICPNAVASLVTNAYGHMTFCEGFVNCDPHPGNILVRQNPDNITTAQLVLLDHGLCRQLDEDFRLTFCTLWKALLKRDASQVKECGEALGAGKFYRYFPLIFTYRSLDSTAPIAGNLSYAEKEQLKDELRQLNISDMSQFMQFLPRDMLFVFRILNLVRSLNKDLGGTSRSRLLTMGKHAIEGSVYLPGGANEAPSGRIAEETSGSLSLGNALLSRIEYNSLLLRLWLVDYAIGLKRWWGGENLTKKNLG